MTATTDTDAGPGPADLPLDGMPPMPPPPPPVAPRQPGAGGRGRSKRGAATKKPAAPSARPRTRRPPVPIRPDYRAGIVDAIDGACVPLALMAMRGDQLAALNMVTLDMHKEGIANSLQAVSEMHPVADRAVGFIAAAGPLSGILTGLSAPILQILTNAGLIPLPIALRMGCTHPQVLLQRLGTFDLHADQAAAAAAPQAAPEPAPDPVI